MSNKDWNKLFSLRPRVGGQTVVINATDANKVSASGHSRINIEVRVGGKVLFPEGSLFVGVSPMHSIDGKEAKELVLSCLAVKPGDTDADFFDSYTDGQLAFVEAHGDELSMWAERYR